MTTTTTNNEFYTNSFVHEQNICNSVQNGLIDSTIASRIESILTPCHPAAPTTLATYYAQSSDVANVPTLIVEDEKNPNDDETEIQGGSIQVFSSERDNGADVLPTPPITPAAAWKDVDVCISELDNTGAIETIKTFQHMPHGHGLSNLEHMGLSRTENYKVLNGENESYFSSRLSSLSVSSKATAVMYLRTPEQDSDGYYTSSSSGNSESRGSRSKSPSYSRSSEDFETSSSNPSVRSQSRSGSNSCSSTSPSSTSIVTSSTTNTSSSSTLSHNNKKRAVESISTGTSFEKYVPLPLGTFTSSRTKMLRSEVQAQMVVQAQRKFFKSEEKVIREKNVFEAAKALLSSIPNQSMEPQATTTNPDSSYSDAMNMKKKKYRDTSKWSYARRTSRFWLKVQRESFWPYTTLGIAELDCFGAGTDRYIRYLENENQLLKAKEKSEWSRELFVKTDSEEESDTNGPEMTMGRESRV